MEKTDKRQPKPSQEAEDRILRAGLCARIMSALQRAFYKAFPPLFYIALDTTLPTDDLLSQLDSIRKLKRTGARVQVLYWRNGTELFQQLPCNDCPMRPEYLTEHIRRQEVVREILGELFATSSEAHQGS